jgi:hypothetical protein
MPQDPTSRSRPRRRGLVLGAALLVAAVASSAAASAVLSQPPSPPIADELQAELDEMLAAGLPADHAKAVMLQDEIDEIRAGADADPPAERGVDVGAVLERARDAERTEESGVAPRAAVPAGDASAAADTRAWESGPVECEPVPGLLDADEVADATCVGVPQPDGTSRYVALGRDGTVRSVHFGPDGMALRLDDTTAGRPVPPGSDVRATSGGDVVVTPPGQAEVTVEVP